MSRSLMYHRLSRSSRACFSLCCRVYKSEDVVEDEVVTSLLLQVEELYIAHGALLLVDLIRRLASQPCRIVAKRRAYQ